MSNHVSCLFVLFKQWKGNDFPGLQNGVGDVHQRALKNNSQLLHIRQITAQVLAGKERLRCTVYE